MECHKGLVHAAHLSLDFLDKIKNLFTSSRGVACYCTGCMELGSKPKKTPCRFKTDGYSWKLHFGSLTCPCTYGPLFGIYIYMGVSKNRGTPKWMAYNGKPLLKWMIWGYHYFWKHPYIYISPKNHGISKLMVWRSTRRQKHPNAWQGPVILRVHGIYIYIHDINDCILFWIP